MDMVEARRQARHVAAILLETYLEARRRATPTEKPADHARVGRALEDLAATLRGRPRKKRRPVVPPGSVPLPLEK